MSFDKDAIISGLGLKYNPLVVLALGRSAEKHCLVEINALDDHSYYRENGVHYVPKVALDDLIVD